MANSSFVVGGEWMAPYVNLIMNRSGKETDIKPLLNDTLRWATGKKNGRGGGRGEGVGGGGCLKRSRLGGNRN